MLQRKLLLGFRIALKNFCCLTLHEANFLTPFVLRPFELGMPYLEQRFTFRVIGMAYLLLLALGVPRLAKQKNLLTYLTVARLALSKAIRGNSCNSWRNIQTVVASIAAAAFVIIRAIRGKKSGLLDE
jgi:hypothetical protein